MTPFRVAALVAIALCACGGESPSTGDETSSSTGAPEPIPCGADLPCPDPETQVCLVEVCHDGGTPELSIDSPEQEMSASWTQGGATTELSVTLSIANFQIVDPSINPDSVRGAGHVVLTLDGIEVAQIMEGDASSVTVMVQAEAAPGGHRLEAQLHLSNGTPYDNPESNVRRFFWFDAGEPHVAIVSPWSGDEFTTGEQPVETRISVLNFQLAPASGTAAPGAVGLGHAFLDADFPACGGDAACAMAYNGVIAPANMDTNALAAIGLPNAEPGDETSLVVHLAQTDHEPYCGEGSGACPPVWDEVTLPRIAPME
jgi:hypothetical protein